MSRSVAFITLGCKVNTAETEGMKRLFEKKGYEIVEGDAVADVYIINTCTVTRMGDKKSRQMLRRVKTLNGDAVIAAVGCFAQVSPEEAASVEGVSLVVGNNLKHAIVELVEQAKPGERQIHVKERRLLQDFEELPAETYHDHTRAFLKIQDGCDQFCSYCIIPHARGPVRSRAPESILKEAMEFAKRGFREIVLTGIHLTAFGNEKEGTGLSSVISAIHDIPEIERIRLGSLEPMFLSSEFIQRNQGLYKLCPHFHVSLQSGSSDTLRRMNRKYTPQDYQQIVSQLRAHYPDAAITTDVMVGFPGETEETFLESLHFCEEIGFSWMHVFQYSPRKGTPAARFENQIERAVKEERSRRMVELAENKRKEFQEGFLQRQLPVLFEQPVQGMEGFMEGLTPNYISVAAPFDERVIGEIKNVRLLQNSGERMLGEIAE